ncbi:hypothetical protein BU24DRAFT_466433 [Aaosphaeria arxii CBS 175.79]|uniref:Uncharacterized protein n=1 Tax=Aaosphaeria arxii CBS 175.79 TaxID=1450172 RepID=A0A6A5XFZ9_9PLEO|nr:uncharacterized protein BU24DRAFT_466433 [Aaosphaeria arxii CBS 175.79]KAF2011757.1 hypothetical protein BU24DRAFT_466433 [Aaosphaeria arxii CBS 175.79]
MPTKAKIKVNGNAPSKESLLSERSMKFYDGTYRWNTDGFEDDTGVFQAWGYDDHNRPPTPNPPNFSDAEDEDEAKPNDQEGSTNASMVRVPHGPLMANYSQALVTKDSLYSHGHYLPLLSDEALLKSSSRPAAPSVEVGGQSFSRTELRRDIFLEKSESDRQRLIGRLEGIHIGHLYAGNGLTLQESYNIVGVDYPDEIIDTITKGRPDVAASPQSVSSSDLSEPPSDIDEAHPPSLLGNLQLDTALQTKNASMSSGPDPQSATSADSIPLIQNRRDSGFDEHLQRAKDARKSRPKTRSHTIATQDDAGSDSDYAPEDGKGEKKRKKRPRKKQTEKGSRAKKGSTRQDPPEAGSISPLSSVPAMSRKRSSRQAKQKTR